MILNIENRGNLVQGIGSSGHDRAERQRGAGETAWWLAAGGLEEQGYWSPTASITWRKVKPLRMRAMGETQTETALAWIRERARYALAFPLYAPSDLLSVPLIHQTQVEISGHRDWEAQPAGAAPPHPATLREAWIHLNANEVQHKQYLQISTHLISKCQMLSNQKYLLTTTILFLISPSQTIRNRENGYYIFKSIPSNSDYVSVALPALTSHPLTWRHYSTSRQNSKFERWCA